MAKIISIHSFRGGTGKSNLSANLAVILAQAGKRVGVIDTDIQSPGIHVLFGLDEERMDKALNDYLWGRCAIEETAYDVSPALLTSHQSSVVSDQSSVVSHQIEETAHDVSPALPIGEGKVAVMSGNVYLVPSSIKAGEITRVLREGYDVGLLNDGFHELVRRLNLDYLLMDTHPGLNEETLLSIAISDILVIIMRPDRQDYQGTAVTVEVARKLNVPRRMLVVNKVLPAYDFAALRQEVQESYQTPVAGILPLSEEMVRLGSSGIFCLRFPDHPFTHTLQEIAQAVLSEPAAAAQG